MSFQNLDISGILENLAFANEKKYNVASTIQIQAVIPPPRPKRCSLEGCKKKLFLSDYPCKCTLLYCAAHRQPELHSCTYDFKKMSETELMKRYGSLVVAKKLDTI